MPIVVSCDQELRVLPLASMNTRDSLLVSLILMALQQHRTVDLKVPQTDGSLLVTCCDQTAIREEGHAAEL